MIDDRMKEFQKEVDKYNHNRDYVKRKFEELNIHFDETELKNATDEIAKHCRSVALSSPKEDHTFFAIDENGFINTTAFERIINIFGFKNIKEFLISRENVKIQKQDEIKYSLQQNNEVGRHLRTINDLMIKEYDNNPVLMGEVAKRA